MEKDEIIIRSAIMHILDSTVGMPVLSDELLNLTPDMNDFLRNHIYKVISGDELKTCVFDEENSEVYRLIQDFTEENMVVRDVFVPILSKRQKGLNHAENAV